MLLVIGGLMDGCIDPLLESGSILVHTVWLDDGTFSLVPLAREIVS